MPLFPGALDDFSAAPPRYVADLEEALEAVEAKLGADGSADRTSVEYKLARRPYYAVDEQTAWDPIAANNDTAYTAAIAAAVAAGGGYVLLPSLLTLATAPEIPTDVNLIGRGSSQGSGGSIVRLTAAAGQVRFGNAASGATGSSGGISQGFRIEGQNVALVPLFTGLTVGRSFKNIDIVDAVDAGMLLEATQNCDFEEVNVQHAGNDLIRVDKGSGSNHFGKCEYGNAGRYNLNIIASISSGLPQFVVPYPINNVWNDGCLFEYGTASTQAMVRVAAGSDNTITDSTIVANSPVRTLIKLEVANAATFAHFRFRGGTLQFNYTHADNTVLNQSGNSTFHQEGKTSITGPTTIGRYDGASASARWDQPVIPAGAAWSVLTNGAPYYNVRSVVDLADAVAIAGAGVYNNRMAVFGRDGSVLGWIHLYSE